MPGRTPREAVEAYAAPIRQTLACITDAVVTYAGGTYPSAAFHTLAFANTAVAPVARLFGTSLRLFFSQKYSVIQRSEGEQEWKVQTRGYFYRVDDENGNEIFSYQWHPFGNLTKQPHMHLARGSGVTREELTHVPTGRIAIESVALYLINEFRVKPRHEECHETILRNLEIFERYRTWA